MTTVCLFYRWACRDVALQPFERELLLRIAREIAVNTIERRLAWNIAAARSVVLSKTCSAGVSSSR